MTGPTLDRLALLVASLCLGVIGLRPASTRLVDPSIVVVRTPGATGAEARLVADSLHAGVLVDASEHGAFNTPGAELHVVGWGLDAREVRRAEGRPIVLHPRPLPDGIREVSWSGPLLLGDPMVVRVTLRERVAGRVILSDESGPVDSLPVPAGEVVSLALRHAPRAVGTARYSLRVGERSDTFSVFVSPAGPPTTLILASAPSREWSDLRDWLAGQGARVTVRMTVSRDRIATDRINDPSSPDRLTAPLLARTDLVVTDGRTLAGLPAAERGVLRAAISNGLGLLLIHDRAAREQRSLPAGDARFFLPWRTATAGDIDSRDVRPRHDGVRTSATPVAAEPFTFGIDERATPILDDGQGGILASNIGRGSGRITATMVTGAGRWLRGGEGAAYAAYWSALVRPTSRRDALNERWDASGGPVMVDREVELVRWGETPGEASIGGELVTFVGDPLIPGRNVARWWPEAPGVVGMDRGWIWVSDTSAWPAWRAAERRRVTEASIGAVRGTKGTEAREPRRTPWPLWPFFLGLVLATGWLWRRTT